MNLREEEFGRSPDGREIQRFILSNDRGLTAAVINFGAVLTSVRVPDRKGRVQEVTLGFDTLEEYVADAWFLGATIGRYANRIARGRFVMDGVGYQLPQNSFPSHLHGGVKGFHKVVWQPEGRQDQNPVGVSFSYLSVDGEEGYPGNLSVSVTYALNDQDELILRYRAEADRATPVNLTNHAYWNLRGAGCGTTLGHVLTLHADAYLPTDDDRIPTGELRQVAGTVMDFTRPAAIGSRIEQVKGGGYNHCYVLRGEGDSLSLAARVEEPETGRVMELLTTEPGLQFYSGHFLKDTPGSGGVVYQKYHGFCLEAQHFPNSVNQPGFPSTLLRPGKAYEQVTIYRFLTA